MSELIYYDLKQVAGLAPSLATQVAREIGRRIVCGTYQPGELVEDEGALAERYQVSRSVIRDAVKILVGKGLLEVCRGIGTRVRTRASWGLLDDDVMAWYQSAPPNSDFFRQLMEIRLIFEPKAARWTSERATDGRSARSELPSNAWKPKRGRLRISSLPMRFFTDRSCMPRITSFS